MKDRAFKNKKELFFNKRAEKLFLFDLPLSFDLWILRLDNLTFAEREVFYSILNEEEKKETSKFRLEHLRDLFIVRRGLSKIILGNHIRKDPDLVTFSETIYKKPYLEGHPKVHFNLTHRNWYALLAINEEPIGIDIEEIKETENFLELLDYFASPHEKRWVCSSLKRFFMLWTIKEALMKAQGTGFLRDNIPVLEELPRKDKNLFCSSSKEYNVYSAFWNNYVISIALEKLLSEFDK